MRKWLLLSVAVVTEVTGSLSLKAALDHPGWYVLTAAGYITAFAVLALVLRHMACGVRAGWH
jgi:small multidrug resistance pump